MCAWNFLVHNRKYSYHTKYCHMTHDISTFQFNGSKVQALSHVLCAPFHSDCCRQTGISDFTKSLTCFTSMLLYYLNMPYPLSPPHLAPIHLVKYLSERTFSWQNNRLSYAAAQSEARRSVSAHVTHRQVSLALQSTLHVPQRTKACSHTLVIANHSGW